jgi:hypothetical protein
MVCQEKMTPVSIFNADRCQSVVFTPLYVRGTKKVTGVIRGRFGPVFGQVRARVKTHKLICLLDN